MRKMKNWILAAAAASALLVVAPSTAKGQVAFQGTFGGPHGQFSIGIGSPAFPVGAYVPYPYVRHIYLRPTYGYGFYYGNQWIPVQAYGNQYVVVQAPVVYSRPYYPYYRHYRYDNRHWDGRYWR
ncbi:MAG TPA: hypothetical protein VKG01_10420 [Thermoanaerobaculia bacterium]|nr:hypothetical protein [Thermoanaerobaculia bacterium]